MSLESFCIHGVSAIIQRIIEGEKYILIQERQKGFDSPETGLIEVPCGKVKSGESVFDCIRSKVLIETGLSITKIYGEENFEVIKFKDYNVLSYIPFFSSQNTGDNYPLAMDTFICEADGLALLESFDAKNIRWVTLNELKNMLIDSQDSFYPMIIEPLKHYLKSHWDYL